MIVPLFIKGTVTQLEVIVQIPEFITIVPLLVKAAGNVVLGLSPKFIKVPVATVKVPPMLFLLITTVPPKAPLLVTIEFV